MFHPAWLDHHEDGLACRKDMLERAKVKGDTLVHEDIEDLLVKHYYEIWWWKELEWRRI